MNITEANAVNTVLAYFLGVHGEDLLPSNERALADTEHLAERANAALQAGITPEDVRDAWTPCGCESCAPGDEPPGRPVTTLTTTGDRL